jgi:hypothetical protein
MKKEHREHSAGDAGQLIALGAMIVLILTATQSTARDLATLVDWMTGSFTSEAQAAADSNYYDIRLEMARVWPERDDGYWLYVEQATAARLDRPYRQRVYHVTQAEDGSFRSEVFSIPDALRFAGGWKNAEPLPGLTPDSLEVREGCAVILVWREDEGFVGGTVGKGCQSDLRGAAYAASEVVVKSDRLVSWDRGLDESGRQVWGARDGGYVFAKKGGVAETPSE